ncbi:MAG: CHAD domain-containing protein [Vicinamibacterales bacterium]
MNRAPSRPTRLMLEVRAKALKQHLPKAIEGDGIGVHHARVASRRLRELVPVLAEDVKGNKPRKAERKIRRLTRALGAVRELDVTLTVLDELAARDTLPRNALEDVRAHVVAEREERRAKMLKRLETVDVQKLDRRLASVAEALDGTHSEDWRKALGGRLAKRGKALIAAMRDAGPMYNPERLHQVRIETKKLRYGLEIAAESGTQSAAPLVRQLRKAQDTLGRLHDLQVLEEHVAAVQTKPPTRQVPEGGLAAIAGLLEEECRHLHGRYLALAPTLTAAVDSSRLVITELVRGSTRRRSLTMARMTRTPKSAALAPATARAATARGRR